MDSDHVECPICFAMVLASSIVKHLEWHAAMNHGGRRKRARQHTT